MSFITLNLIKNRCDTYAIQTLSKKVYTFNLREKKTGMKGLFLTK